MDFGIVNKGLVAYFAEGGPAGDHTRADSVFAGGQELLQAVVGIVRESLSVPAHWNTTSAIAGAAIMKHEMKRRHEELDEQALQVLAENFTASWR